MNAFVVYRFSLATFIIINYLLLFHFIITISTSASSLSLSKSSLSPTSTQLKNNNIGTLTRQQPQQQQKWKIEKSNNNINNNKHKNQSILIDQFEQLSTESSQKNYIKQYPFSYRAPYNFGVESSVDDDSVNMISESSSPGDHKDNDDENHYAPLYKEPQSLLTSHDHVQLNKDEQEEEGGGGYKNLKMLSMMINSKNIMNHNNNNNNNKKIMTMYERILPFIFFLKNFFIN